MKALFINGSPRKKWNAVKVLESAMKGAQEAGAEVELGISMTLISKAVRVVSPVS